jgi:hypothetical protein
MAALSSTLRVITPDDQPRYDTASALALRWLQTTGRTASVDQAFEACGYRFSTPDSLQARWFTEKGELVKVQMIFADKFDETWVRARMPYETEQCPVHDRDSLLTWVKGQWPRPMSIFMKGEVVWPYPGAQTDLETTLSRSIMKIETKGDRDRVENVLLYWKPPQYERETLPPVLRELWHKIVVPPETMRRDRPMAWKNEESDSKRAHKKGATARPSFEELMAEQRRKFASFMLITPPVAGAVETQKIS